MAEGVDGLLHDKTRPARIPPLPKAVVEGVVTRTLDEAPPDEATHWTAPAMAAASGLSVSSVQRIWRAHGLRPHQVRRFKLSTDPKFAEKVEDIVGLYVDPPAHAVVLSIDEKSQIQALDRTQPGLPMKKGRAGTMTHDYKRHGTTTLFAALNVLDGSVIGRCMQRHRHQEFIRFLNAIERDGAGRQADPRRARQLRRPQAGQGAALARPPSALDLPLHADLVLLAQRGRDLLRQAHQRRLKRGVFHSLVALQTAINRFVETHNRDPKPFVWKADPNAIIAAAKRGYQALDSIPGPKWSG